MGIHRKIIKIKAADSPNVQLGISQVAAGLQPTNEILVPGLLTYQEYLVRRATWDIVRQTVGLDGDFYEGAEILLFPPLHLNLAEEYAKTLTYPRPGVTMGVDTGEGGDDTCWAVCDEKGLVFLKSLKTPDTSVIPGITLGLMNEYEIEPDHVWFDRGGGGREHCDALKRQGYEVNEVSFGETANEGPAEFWRTFEERKEERHEQFTYRNKRAQIYHILSQRLRPVKLDNGELVSRFAMPPSVLGEAASYVELRRQLAPMPLLYDDEGRIVMLPKKRKPGAANDGKQVKCLQELIGCSPDEADALALASYALDPEVAGQMLSPLF